MASDAIRLSVAITAVPSRLHYLARLEAQLGAWQGFLIGAPDVYIDHDYRGSWYNSQRAWHLTPDDATHRLLLQEDISVCRDFYAGVLAVAARYPACMVNFGLTLPMARAYAARGEHFMPLLHAGGCAQLLPAAWAHDFVTWAAGIDVDRLPLSHLVPSRLPARVPHDDLLLFEWLQEEGRAGTATVPALVMHRGRADTLIWLENDTPWWEQQEENYIGDDASALAVDWGAA